MSEEKFKKIISHAKEYGFVFQSSEIYDGLSAVYDYGQNGVLLKNNIKDYWWKSMINMNDNIVGLDSAIFSHPTTWKASGHVLKNEKRIGEKFDLNMFLSTNERAKKYNSQINNLKDRLNKALNEDNLNELKQIILDNNILCPISGSCNWTDVKQFNLMFNTKFGASLENSSDLYLRPETAQGIFLNYMNVLKTGRMKIPFGIAQIGKAFRNEIIARQFIFRMREFEQMEMQFFIKPGDQKKWYEFWKDNRMKWHLSLGIDQNKFRFHDHEKLAHYADAACDIEFDFPFGFKELEGIHSRTDFDLSNHENFSSKQIKYFDPVDEKKYTPYVIETSIGLDRMFLAVFSQSLNIEKLSDGTERTVLKIPKILASNKCAIFPLVKKDGLPEIASSLKDQLKLKYNVIYDEKDAIGKRYRRQDAIGTPYCITIDHQTNEDNTVTIRDRDSMVQERIPIENIESFLSQSLDISNWL